MKFRKKPVVIEAVRCRELIHHARNDFNALPKWFVDCYEQGGMVICPDHIIIPTLEGNHRADLNDMVICGVKGELYPCKPDIFDATYEAVP